MRSLIIRYSVLGFTCIFLIALLYFHNNSSGGRDGSSQEPKIIVPSSPNYDKFIQEQLKESERIWKRGQATREAAEKFEIELIRNKSLATTRKPQEPKISVQTTTPAASNHEKFIQKRLEESERIWKRGLVSREAKEIIETPVSADKPWDLVSYRNMWDFFYPRFNCPHISERIGKVGHGGKWTCGVGHIIERGHPCVIYSFGNKNDTTFEEEMLNRTKCVVFAYDFSVDENQVSMSKLYPLRHAFHKLGLGHENKGEYNTLKTAMDSHGTKFIDILKIDVDGEEYYVLPQILKDFPDNLPFGQLLIEFHLDKWPQGPNLYKDVKGFLESLEHAGLRAFHIEPNFDRLSYYL